MTQTWLCATEQETEQAAREIAESLTFPAMLCLSGDLGAGKTALCRAMIRHLIHDPDAVIPSPTYTLVQTYETEDREIWHFDLYRLEHPDHLYDLGWEEALTADLCLIEWPERLGALKPKTAIDLGIDILPDDRRAITLQAESLCLFS